MALGKRRLYGPTLGRPSAIASSLWSREDFDSYIRLLSPAAWYRADTGVTGLSASTWADQSGNGRDLLQGTDANRPPYLSYSGTKYLYLPGSAGNRASSPDSAALTATTSVSIRAKVMLTDWTPLAVNFIGGQYNGVPASDGTMLYIDAGGEVSLVLTASGSVQAFAKSTANPTVSDGADLWVRGDYDVATTTAKFYTSSDGSSWTQLGADVSAPTITSLNNSSQIFTIGIASDNNSGPLSGRVYRLMYYADGVLKADFNPDLYGTDGSSTLSSATGETWTVDKSASGLIAYLVGSPWLMGDGTADSMATGAFVLDQPCTIYTVGKDLTWTLNDYICDGAAKDSGALIQSATTPRFMVSAGSAIGENAGLAVGTLGVRCAVINGASSLTQVNLGTPVTGDAGAAQMDGITIFSSGAVVTGWWNGMMKEHLVFPAAHDATQRARVVRGLMLRHRI